MVRFSTPNFTLIGMPTTCHIAGERPKIRKRNYIPAVARRAISRSRIRIQANVPIFSDR